MKKYEEKMNYLLEQNNNKQQMINRKIKKLQQIRLKYDEQINILRKEFKKIRDAQYLPLYDSISATNKLICDIEKEKYVIQTLEVFLNINNIKTKYNIVYFVKEEAKDRINKYLLSLFKNHKTNLKEVFTTPNDDYMFIAYYKNGDNKAIAYEKDNEFYLTTRNESILTSKIFDSKYDYIFDYIDMLLEYRLDKDDLELNLEDMFSVEQLFIQNYRKDNKVYKIIK